MAFGSAGLAILKKSRNRKSNTDLNRSMASLKRKMLVQKRLGALNTKDWNPTYRKFVFMCVKVEANARFNRLITVAITIAGILAGVSTYQSMERGRTISVLDNLILYLFALEVAIKIAARGTRPWSYFYDSWNRFDFTIVLLSFLPLGFDFTVLRTLRLLRVLRLINAFTKLRILVQSLYMSFKAILYVCMLLLLVFYIYSVTAVILFKSNDPLHFRSLEISLLSMYRCATFEDWTDIMYINAYGCDKYGYPSQVNLTNLDGSRAPTFMSCTDPQAYGFVAVFFFCSFTLFTTMILFNLFIGVILINIEKSQDNILEEIRREFRLMASQMFFVDVARHSLKLRSNMSEPQQRWFTLKSQIVSGKWRDSFPEEIAQLKAERRHKEATGKVLNCEDLLRLLTDLDSEIARTSEVLDDIEGLGVYHIERDAITSNYKTPKLSFPLRTPTPMIRFPIAGPQAQLGSKGQEYATTSSATMFEVGQESP